MRERRKAETGGRMNGWTYVRTADGFDPPSERSHVPTFLRADPQSGLAGWLVVVLLALTTVDPAAAQHAPFDAGRTADLLPSPGILRNSVAELHAEGDSLWLGPFLNLTTDGGETWQVADADSLAGFRNRVYSLDVEGNVIWAGLGVQRRQDVGGETRSVDFARGLLVSTDGGTSWTYRTYEPPPDDDPSTTGLLDLPDDTLVTYGVSTLPALAVTVPEDSPPWGIDYDPHTGTVWTANQVAGIRRSTDGGQTWQRVVLPPDTSDAIYADSTYSFFYSSQPIGVSIEQFAGLNFQAFSVLVDESGTVWAGTVGGINRSEDRGQSWHRKGFDRTTTGLPGNWIIAIREQPLPGSNPVWIACWPAINQGEQFGLVVTADGGESFERRLMGERIYDVGFQGTTVYAAGENGLFISRDDGLTWRTERDFYDPSQPDRTVRPDVSAFAVAATRDAVWVGTSDGLFKSTDGGETWTLFRTQVPLDPDDAPDVMPRDAVPEVDAYAYPNPFSPNVDRLVRIRYDTDQPQDVTVRIFDFGMHPVRELTTRATAGPNEVAWDGLTDEGARVANGTYLYAVQTDRGTAWGKILVLE